MVALVGYANAGKSSLMRALSGADVLVADAPFATLDPVTRRITVPRPGGGDAALLLTDTVGFIQKLPPQLVSAFRATLEELDSADLLLHVVDATSPAAAAQAQTVVTTLDDLGLARLPVLTVLNKVDGLRCVDGSPVQCEADIDRLDIANPASGGTLAVPLSALRGWAWTRSSVTSRTSCWARRSRRRPPASERHRSAGCCAWTARPSTGSGRA